MLVYYEMLGVYLKDANPRQVARVRKIIERLSPKVIAKLKREREAREKRAKN